MDRGTWQAIVLGVAESDVTKHSTVLFFLVENLKIFLFCINCNILPHQIVQLGTVRTNHCVLNVQI